MNRLRLRHAVSNHGRLNGAASGAGCQNLRGRQDIYAIFSQLMPFKLQVPSHPRCFDLCGHLKGGSALIQPYRKSNENLLYPILILLGKRHHHHLEHHDMATRTYTK
jgi:hypothetical protein